MHELPEVENSSFGINTVQSSILVNKRFDFTVSKWFLALCMFLTSAQSFASSANFDWSLASFNEPKGGRAGIEIAASQQIADTITIRGAGVIFSGKDFNSDDTLFGGLSVSGFAHFPYFLSPYVGGGLQISNTVFCIILEDDENPSETPDECQGNQQTVIALYPEVGFKIDLGALKIAPFARRYFDTNNNLPVTNAYGLQLSFSF